MRDNNWLAENMYDLWENNFVDIPRKNLVVIKFGKRSFRQLGSITWATNKSRGLKSLLKNYEEVEDDERISLITVTKYFQDSFIPDEVVQGTIAHEMIHYAHGFNSPLKQIYQHPHKGGVIRKEMVARGLEDIFYFQKKWLKSEWQDFISRNKK